MSNIQSGSLRDNFLILRQRISFSPPFLLCPSENPPFAALIASKIINSSLCQPLVVVIGTSVSDAAISYFKTIRRSSVPAGNVLPSNVPQPLFEPTAGVFQSVPPLRNQAASSQAREPFLKNPLNRDVQTGSSYRWAA